MRDAVPICLWRCSVPKAEGRRRAASITDVARVAGVSPQTVSNVVNERGGYTEATRRTVLAAIAQTGYTPNRAARQLRTRRTRQIGFILEDANLDVGNPFTLSLLRAVVTAAEPVANRVVVFTGEPDDEHTIRHWAAVGDVDGFLFNNASPGDARTRLLTGMGVPVAVLGQTLPSEPQSWVDVRNREAMHEVVDHLLARGHRRIGYVGQPGPHYWLVDRQEAARGRLEQRGAGLPDALTLVDDFDSLGPRIAGLLTSPDRPTAIITGGDNLAGLVINHARAAGVTVGATADLAVTGFDGGLLTWSVIPSLTSVRIPVDRIATELVARLLREIEAGPTDEPGTYVPTELIVAGSA